MLQFYFINFSDLEGDNGANWIGFAKAGKGTRGFAKMGRSRGELLLRSGTIEARLNTNFTVNT